MNQLISDCEYYSNKIIEQIQNMEEITGPVSLNDYVSVLNVVKAEVEKRLAACQNVGSSL